jgi:lipoteichoic acid synthase
MLPLLRSAPGRTLRVMYQALERTRGAEVVIFYVLMVMKLCVFNYMIAVRNMQLTPDDVVIAAGTLAVCSFWTVFLPFRGRLIALIVLNMLLTAILYSDLVYYRYFQDILSIPVLLQAGQVGALGDSIATLLMPRDAVYFADWLLLLPFALYAIFAAGRTKRHAAASVSRPRRMRLTLLRCSLGLLILSAGLTLVFVPVNAAKSTWAKGLFTGNWWNVSLYNVTGLYGYHGYDIYRFAKQQMGEKSLAPEDAKLTRDWFAERGSMRDLIAAQDPLFGAYRGSNVVMIQVEALQNFLIGRSVAGQEITPNLNALLKDSVYYSRFYHQTSQGRTSDADFAAHCSQQPMQSGSVFIRYASHEFDCLPGALKSEGYSTAAFHAYDGGFWNRNMMYDRMQYDHFYSKKHFQMDETLGWSLGDASFFRQSAAYMKERRQPSYSFLITLSSHHPYKIPGAKQKLDVSGVDYWIMRDYLQSVRYADEAVGSFIAQLKADGLWDNTILLLYGDHDNSIRVWESFEQIVGKPLNAVERQQVLKQVPLIVHLPDNAMGGTVREEVGGQLDLAPSILHLLGVKSGAMAMVGKPLVTSGPAGAGEHRIVFRNGTWTDGKVYYLPTAAQDGGSGCFDAVSGDPVEANACEAGTEAAKREITMSSNAVEYDLIGAFRLPEAQEQE